MTNDQFRQLARRGAALRMADLVAEMQAISAAFPDLIQVDDKRPRAAAAPKNGERKRRPMTAGEKAAVSKRMKAYWKARRRRES